MSSDARVKQQPQKTYSPLYFIVIKKKSLQSNPKKMPFNKIKNDKNCWNKVNG